MLYLTLSMSVYLLLVSLISSSGAKKDWIEILGKLKSLTSNFFCKQKYDFDMLLLRSIFTFYFICQNAFIAIDPHFISFALHFI